MRMRIIVTALALTACAAALGYQAETPAVKTGAPPPQATVSSRDALIARAKSLELNTPYVPPPGDRLEPRTSGFAKIMCSAVVITELDAVKVKQAVEAAFEPAAGMTAAFVVTWRGRLIAERYGEGITEHTPLESWSMGRA